MASSEAPSEVKMIIENVERTSIEFQQLEKCSEEFRNNIQEIMCENDKNLNIQEIIDTISYLDKSLAYLHFIKYVENIR